MIQLYKKFTDDRIKNLFKLYIKKEIEGKICSGNPGS